MADALPPERPVDGLTIPAQNASTPKPPSPSSNETSVLRLKRTIIFIGGALYLLYAFWDLCLLLILPSPTGEFKALVSFGVISSLLGIVCFIGVGLIFLMRISKADVSTTMRSRTLVKVIAVLLPGIGLSIIVPLMIIREPALTIDIVSPTRAEDFVAPLPVTFSLERAVATLKGRGLVPIKYQWDFDGDGKPNEETAVPTVTAYYERSQSYTFVARITMQDGSFRRLTKTVIIPRAVFTVEPHEPIVQKPIRFSVADLITDAKSLKEVHWDFDGDGKEDEKSQSPDTVHTYYSVGPQTVTAVVLLENNSQGTYKRTFEVKEQPPLPFPVKIISEPVNLIGPAPFGASFRVESTEQLKEIEWIFGDTKEERGADLKKVLHAYEHPGIYALETKVLSSSGELADLTTIVRVTEPLQLSDLSFEGTTSVLNNRIEAEAPLTIQLTPKTAAPLIQFLWEAPDASSVQITGNTLQAIYRHEGNYTVTLLAQDPNGRALRLPLTIVVKTPSAAASFKMKPESGVAPLTVTLDASDTFIPPGEDIAGFKWQFGDEERNSFSELGTARVEHTYRQAGQYTIVLHVVLASGKEVTAQRAIIVRPGTLSACLTASRVEVSQSQGVEFDSTCTTGSPVSILWDVRYDKDPSIVQAQSSDKKYVYVFQKVGTYTVTLTIKDQSGNEDKKTISITVTP